MREEKAIILDFLLHGYPSDSRPMHRKTAIAQAIGADHFILLELVPKKGTFFKPLEEVYTGEGKRDKIHHILGKIGLSKLTQTAKISLDSALHDIISKNEDRFIKFFNTAGPINTRSHFMELLPGIGKKHMKALIEVRDEKEFKDFEDIKSRVKLVPDPERLVIKRILAELNGDDRYKIFTEA